MPTKPPVKKHVFKRNKPAGRQEEQLALPQPAAAPADDGGARVPSAAELAVLAEVRRARRRLRQWFPLEGGGALFLGDGDFSFALSVALRGVEGVVSSSYESEASVREKYRLASANIDALRRLGVELLFGVDATSLQAVPALECRRFARVVFNFPHSGVPNYQKESIPSNQKLLRGLMRSAAPLLAKDGELRLTLRKDPVYHAWGVMEQAKVAFEERLGKAAAAKRALCPCAREEFPYQLFFGYRHAATVEDRAVDNPQSVTWVLRLQKAWAPPAELAAAVLVDIKWSRGEYRCAVCDITFKANKQLEMHEAGRKHKEAVEAASGSKAVGGRAGKNDKRNPWSGT